ncbi:MAG: transcriptional repressor [Actinobacteria bacterium]|nr:transcriptional repressor [Actinomycetota bacterium]
MTADPRPPATAAVGEVLREHGYRLTQPRQLVWDVLREAGDHLTAEEIADRVQRRSPGINLASVYRSLALLSDLELVRESRLGESGAARWELAHPDEHFHLVCETCGEVAHHVGNLVEQVRQHLSAGHGFHVDSVELVVTGRCAECAP